MAHAEYIIHGARSKVAIHYHNWRLAHLPLKLCYLKEDKHKIEMTLEMNIFLSLLSHITHFVKNQSPLNYVHKDALLLGDQIPGLCEATVVCGDSAASIASLSVLLQ